MPAANTVDGANASIMHTVSRILNNLRFVFMLFQMCIRDREYTVEVSNYKIEVLAPCEEEYEDINNYSIVVKITIGEKRFLFCGDAEALSEEQMVARFDVSADVLKVGHHGSVTSTSEAFLEAVSPQYAVIFCGKDNSYGHPHQQTLDQLAARDITVYRTDLNGTIVMTTDGQNIDVVVQYQEGERENSLDDGEDRDAAAAA